ncbi:MAG: STAS domain-containing protein [Candidatus Phosphoribacter sp.]|nr:STAS domain-containing protein [Actinomycetales bacterium]
MSPAAVSATRPTRRARTVAGAPVEVLELPFGVLVRVGGRLDSRSIAAVRDTLHQVIDAGSGPIRVELPEAEIGDATALGLLVGAHHRARRLGRDLHVGEMSDRTARLLRMSHLDRVLAGSGLARRPARPRPATDPQRSATVAALTA